MNCSDIVWLKQLLKGMKEDITKPIVIYYDYIGVINISKNLVMYTKTKHISIECHYLRELFQNKEVRLGYVNTKEKIADIFTKALPKESHEHLKGKLGVISLTKAT